MNATLPATTLSECKRKRPGREEILICRGVECEQLVVVIGKPAGRYETKMTQQGHTAGAWIPT